MTSTCYKEDRSLLHRRHEVVPRAHLPDELVRRIHDRVDLPSQLPVGIRQSVHDLAQRNVSDDQQIDIAALLQLTSRRRSENEGRHHLRRERRKGRAQNIDDAGRLGQQRQKLREHR